MDERVDIVITDQVSPEVERKLLAIANAAKQADQSLARVVSSLAKIKPKEINAVATAQAKLDAATSKTALATQRLATESTKTAAAQAKLNMATDRAAIAQTQLATAQVRLTMAQAQAAAAADRAAMAHIRLERSQQATRRSSGFLSQALHSVYIKLAAIYAASQSVGAIIQLVDAYTFMENRLRAVGVATDDVGTAMSRLQFVANSTRNSLQSTVELYARLSLSTKQFGYSQSDLLKVTTAMNQAIRIGGSTTQEASNALIQLSQGMSSGRLQGDELRSVLEQLPIVADVIAKHLGITRGELRQFGREGKLTTAAIMEAFTNAAPELQARFRNLTMTVDEALTYFKNKFQVAMKKELGEAMQALAKILVLVADNLEDLIPLAKTFIGLGLGLKVASIVTSFTSLGVAGSGAFAAIGLRLTALVNPLTAMVALLAEAYYIYQLINREESKRQGDEEKKAANDRMITLNSQLNNLKAQRIQQEGLIKSMKEQGFDKGVRGQAELRSAEQRLREINEQGKVVAKNYAATQAVLGDTIERIDGTSQFTQDLQKTFDKYMSIVKGEIPGAKEDDDKLTINIQSSITDYAGLRAQLDQVFAAKQRYGQAVLLVTDAMRTGNMTIELANSLLSKLEEEYNNLLSPITQINKELDFQQKQLGLTAEQVEVNNKMRELELTYMERGLALAPEVAAAYRLRLEFLQEETKRLREREELIKSVRGPDAPPSVATVNKLVTEGAVTRDQAQGYFVRNNETIFEGSQEAMDANVKAYKDMYAKINELRQADYMSTESASKAKVRLWFKEHDSLITDTASTFGALAELSQSSNKQLAAIGYAAANIELAINSVRAISLAWSSAPFPWNVPAVAATTAAMAVQEAKLNNLAGFAFGGGFTVGGVGGIDSQTVAFRATPGEEVSITTPEQRARQSSSSVTNVYHYHDHVSGGTKAERESRFTQFQRETRTVSRDRASERAQVALA